MEATAAGIRKAERMLTDKNWSRQELANRVEIGKTIGISIQTVQQFFRRRSVSRRSFVGICTALDLNWEEILGAIPDEPSPPPLPIHPRSEYRRAIETASQRVWVYQTWLPGIEMDGDYICSSEAADVRLLLLSFKEESPMYSRIKGRKMKVLTAKHNSTSSVRAFAKCGRLEQVRFNYGHHPAWITVADALVFWGPTPVDEDSHSAGFLFHAHSANSIEGKFWINQFEVIWNEYSHTFKEEQDYNQELSDLV